MCDGGSFLPLEVRHLELGGVPDFHIFIVFMLKYNNTCSKYIPPYDNLKDQLLVLTEEMTTWNCFDRKEPQYYLNKFQQG